MIMYLCDKDKNELLGEYSRVNVDARLSYHHTKLVVLNHILTYHGENHDEYIELFNPTCSKHYDLLNSVYAIWPPYSSRRKWYHNGFTIIHPFQLKKAKTKLQALQDEFNRLNEWCDTSLNREKYFNNSYVK